MRRERGKGSRESEGNKGQRGRRRERGGGRETVREGERSLERRESA